MKNYKYCPFEKEEVNIRKCLSCIYSNILGDTNLFNVPCNYKKLIKE